VTVRVLLRHYGFAMAYLAGVVAAGLAYTLLDPGAQARLIATPGQRWSAWPDT
jgi:hypothetical protein